MGFTRCCKEFVKGFISKCCPFYYRKLRIQRDCLVSVDEARKAIDIADQVLIEIQGVKPVVGVICDDRTKYTELVSLRSSWIKYIRFLENNNIPYEIYDIHRSNWLEESKKFDLIIWHVDSSPVSQQEAEDKLYILGKRKDLLLFPNYNELWHYENKVRAGYLYKLLGLPSIKTFISNSYDESREFIEETQYPIISKIATGSGSVGVQKIDNVQVARKLVDKLFSRKGVSTYWKYLNQKSYVFFQEYISDATFDLRIFIVDNKAFGYYRYPKKGDFKASGSGIYEKKELPMEAIRLAISTVIAMESRLMSVDLLYSVQNNSYQIIETSLFNQIDTCEQLVVDGIPGYYDISDENAIKFIPGKFWLQELALKVAVLDWLKLNSAR